MKRVLIICGKLCIGGAEKVAYSIGHYADKEKYECHYIVFGADEGEYEKRLYDDGCKIFHIQEPAKSYLEYMKTICNLINTHSYDVIHCHTMFNSGIVMLLAKLKKVPNRITHSHSICSDVKRPIAKKIYERIMRYLICRCATDYVACGQKSGEWLYGEKFFRKNGMLLLNGIDTLKFQYNEIKRKEIREKLDLEGNWVVGHVGHLAEVKNQKFLLELLPELIKKNSKVRLLLVGEGPEREKLEQKIVEMKLSDYVIMTGNVMDVENYLSAMDVFVFPSLYEGMPLAMLEVQTNGLPAVMSNTVPKDVHLTNLLTVLSLNDSYEKWVQAIRSSCRRESEKYCSQMYEQGYDIKTMVKKIYALYE